MNNSTIIKLQANGDTVGVVILLDDHNLVADYINEYACLPMVFISSNDVIEEAKSKYNGNNIMYACNSDDHILSSLFIIRKYIENAMLGLIRSSINSGTYPEITELGNRLREVVLGPDKTYTMVSETYDPQLNDILRTYKDLNIRSLISKL